MKYITTIGDQQFTIDINHAGEVTVDGEVINVDLLQMQDTTMYSMIIGHQSHDVRMSEGDGFYEVQVSGDIFQVVVEDERTRRLAGLKRSSEAVTGEVFLKAPMPGVVVEIPVEKGQRVAKGDIVLILESMKMQNEFKAPRDGIIHMLRVGPGDTVEQNAVMLTIV
jgi:biotin carboxyl carrier protein